MFKNIQALTANFAAWTRAEMIGSANYRKHLMGEGAVGRLERKIARFYGAKYALCTSSATHALLAVCSALELNGRDFITSPLNFGASLAAWLLCGNCPVFADVDPDTLTIDPNAITAAMTANTRAILSIDHFGYPADDAALRRVADELGIWYVADSAQAFGAMRDGKPASSLADAIVVSFNSQKTLRAGEGGCVVTNNRMLYERLLWNSQHQVRQKRELGLGIYNEFAFNSRIHPAAVASALSSFDHSFDRLHRYQKLCLSAISILESEGLIESVDLRQLGIMPSFFGLVVTPAGTACEWDVKRFLFDHGLSATSRFVSSPTYRNSVFLQLYRTQYYLPRPCPVAEEAISRLVLSDLTKTNYSVR